MFYDNLKQALEKQGKKVSPFLKEMGYSSSNATKWKSGKLPDTEILIRICEKLNVSADVLLDINIDALKDNSGMTDEEKRIIYSYRKHPEMKIAVFKILEIEEGECVMQYQNITIEHMNYYQRQLFKTIMKEHLVSHYKTDEFYAMLCNDLNVESTLSWFRTTIDCSLDNKVSEMMCLVSKKYDTFFDEKLFEIKSSEFAKRLGIEVTKNVISGAELFVRLAKIPDPVPVATHSFSFGEDTLERNIAAYSANREKSTDNNDSNRNVK